MSTTKRVDAVLFFGDERMSLCENYSDHDSIMDMLDSLMDCGVKKIDVEIEEGEEGEDIYVSGALYLTVSNKITKELLVEICSIHPDEISIEQDDTIRIWWD